MLERVPINAETEEKIKELALKFLEKGRPNWDVPHTLAAVHWIKELIKQNGGNERILVTAMYLHDIGYSGQFEEECTFDSICSQKPSHMKIGAKLAQKVLTRLNFTKEEIREITHLISIHDNFEEINVENHNESLVFEADSLSHIDINRVKSSFSKEDVLKWLTGFEQKRLPLFRTELGKENASKFLNANKEYFKCFSP